MAARCAARLSCIAAALALTDFSRRDISALPEWPSTPYPDAYAVSNASRVFLDAPAPAAHTTTQLHYRPRNSTFAEPRLERRRLKGAENTAAELRSISPLFMGIGTHYAHVYVGTPPQRVSVIVDTGSHHTAFPCSGCKSCGTHTDPYFDPERSSTLKWLGCSDCVAAAHCMQRKCQVSQSYTEGSSWKANQIKDALYVGGETVISQPASETWLSTSFIFGCQISETGLFRTQKADGIMGMSMNAQTLVPTMNANGQLHKNAFALCFMHGGGSMTLGGVEAAKHTEAMQFVPLTKHSGWYTVALTDILIGGKSIGLPKAVYATGKGTIVDSGTTDTYLPRRCSDKFKEVWASTLGAAAPKYANTKMTFTPAQEALLPTLTYVFDNGVKVDVKPEAYMEKAGGKYIPRVYLTEASGTVLGANFMQDHDVLFDAQNTRIGFAKAKCGYAAPPQIPAKEALAEAIVKLRAQEALAHNATQGARLSAAPTAQALPTTLPLAALALVAAGAAISLQRRSRRALPALP